MKITRKGYIRRFVKLFMKETLLSYKYAKDCAEYFADNKEEFGLWEVKCDVYDCIQDHIR